ncbi:MAG: sigma-70 family RNA polymerase sigma factor [Aeromicrobium sp.]|uniref:sigma-70 family RNA polymerase sigma factor n=1 Tax=Aeromicrobium sp. TaxID=1871063 RepID=UPI0039E66935
MAITLPAVDDAVTASDAELIAAVRAGDTEAYGVLFSRHRLAAERLARQLVVGAGADDLVSEAFVKVLSLLQRGAGPNEAFRAYLLTAVRRLHIDALRSASRERPTEDEADLDRQVEFVDPAAMKFERGAAGRAFESLPERWQLVLWHLDVEGQTPAEIAPLLDMAPNSVSALAYRAREGLRRAYLQEHLAPSLDDACRAAIGKLGSHVRHGLSARDTAKVEAHLDVCARCAGLALELREVNDHLAAVLAPALLGTAASGYLGGLLGAGAAPIVGVGAASGVSLSHMSPTSGSGPGLAGAAPAAAVAAVIVGTAAMGSVPAATDTTPTPTSRPSVASEDHAPRPLPDHPARRPLLLPPVPMAAAAVPVAVASAVLPALAPEAAPVARRPDSPPPDGDRSPEAPPTTPPTAPTDFTLGTPQLAETADGSGDYLRTLTLPITGAATGPTVADQQLTVRIDFSQPVWFESVGDGWSCADPTGFFMFSITCSATAVGGEAPAYSLRFMAADPIATVTLTVEDDPDGTGDTASFDVPWL